MTKQLSNPPIFEQALSGMIQGQELIVTPKTFKNLEDRLARFKKEHSQLGLIVKAGAGYKSIKRRK
jgi:hypothetical protein